MGTGCRSTPKTCSLGHFGYSQLRSVRPKTHWIREKRDSLLTLRLAGGVT